MLAKTTEFLFETTASAFVVILWNGPICGSPTSATLIRLPSEDIVEELTKIEDGPWAETIHGKPNPSATGSATGSVSHSPHESFTAAGIMFAADTSSNIVWMHLRGTYQTRRIL